MIGAKHEVILGEIAGREAAFLLAHNQLEDILIEADGPAIGTIYRGRAGQPLKGQGGLIVETPDGPAWLRGAKGVAPGALILVQVSGVAEQGKAIPVTQKLSFKSRYSVITPGAPGTNISRLIRDPERREALAALFLLAGEFGLILRSSCAWAEREDIAEDISLMRDLAERILADEGGEPEILLNGDAPHQIAWREWGRAGGIAEGREALSERGVFEMISEALQQEISLGQGGRAWIEPCRALIAVDVDTGSDRSPAAGLKANLALADRLPRALRLRGLGGQIVIDAAPMAVKHRKSVEERFKRALRDDPVATDFIGWTNLGHIELSRKRERPLLDRLISASDLQ